MKLLTVSGSLRTGSSNSALLDALATVAPSSMTVARFDGLRELPAFDPDLEQSGEALPPPVVAWQQALAQADAVLLSSPEYAHGVPGVLKNALDWVVGSGEFVGKRTGLLSASSASAFAHPQLVEILTVMSASMVPEATRVIDIPRRGVTPEGLLADARLRGELTAVLDAFQVAALADRTRDR
jgi:NAD(P)H-dependent FMN reductase